MDCIPYINDLLIEIKMLEELDSSNPEIKGKILIKREKIDKVKENLSKMSVNSIEYRIYLKMLNGLTPTRAINEIATENYEKDIKPAEESIIWKKYYKNLKKMLKSSESPVK